MFVNSKCLHNGSHINNTTAGVTKSKANLRETQKEKEISPQANESRKATEKRNGTELVNPTPVALAFMVPSSLTSNLTL